MNAAVWISLAGLAATVTVSIIGFYFTHKAQRSPLRQELYKKQIEILTSFTLVATRIQLVADTLRLKNQLSEPEFESAKNLWHDLTGDLLEVTQKGGVILPASAYSAMTAFRATVQDFEEVMIQDEEVKEVYFAMMGALAHAFMIGREIVGADALSSESIRLHSAEGYNNMNQIGRHALAEVSTALWTRAKYTEATPPRNT